MGKRGPIAGAKPSRQTPVFSMRLHPQLRQNLEEIANRNRRSLADEISRRLDDSLTYSRKVADAFGNERNFVLMQMITAPLKKSVNWLDDPQEFDRCIQLITDLLENIRPVGPRDNFTRASRLLTPELGDGIGADATWAMVKSVDTTKPRHERDDFEHFAINAKSVLGDIVERADPLFRSRQVAIARLTSAYPEVDFSKMADDELFAREEALVSEWREHFDQAMNEPPPYDPNWRDDQNG